MARYKAEAGLSRRGYVHHASGSGWVEEGEVGLIGVDRGRRGGTTRGENGAGGDGDGNGGAGVDYGYGGQMITDTDTSGDDDDERGRVRDEWEKDNLKWPAGEGWKPLTG